MLVAHKIALDPNKAERQYFARAAGTSRFACNWALGEWRKQTAAGGKPSEVSLRRELKREQFPRMLDVTECAVQEAIIDLGAAFRAFFARLAASSAVTACGEDRAGAVRKSRERASLKQEENTAVKEAA